MFKKLFGARSPAPVSPYKQDQMNAVYQMLFCDDPAQGGTPMFGDSPDARLVKGIAQSATEESRVRLLAGEWLRANGHPAPAQDLLGIVVEVPLEEGLDVLCTYGDGRVRYLNHMGRIAIIDGPAPDVREQGQALLTAAIGAAAIAAPAKRRDVPKFGKVRFSYLSLDGVRVHEASFSDIGRDPLAAPVLEHAQKLLDLVITQASAA